MNSKPVLKIKLHDFHTLLRLGIGFFRYKGLDEKSKSPQKNILSYSDDVMFIEIPEKYQMKVIEKESFFFLLDELLRLSLSTYSKTTEEEIKFANLGEAWLPFHFISGLNEMFFSPWEFLSPEGLFLVEISNCENETVFPEMDDEITGSDLDQDSTIAPVGIEDDDLIDVGKDESDKKCEIEKQVDSESKIGPDDEMDIPIVKKDDEESEISLKEGGEEPNDKDNNELISEEKNLDKAQKIIEKPKKSEEEMQDKKKHDEAKLASPDEDKTEINKTSQKIVESKKNKPQDSENSKKKSSLSDKKDLGSDESEQYQLFENKEKTEKS